MLDWINVFKVNRKIKSRLWPWIKIILSIILFFAVFYGDIYVHILDKTKTGRIVEALILVVFSFLDYLIASIGHPLAGDTKYGDAEFNRRFREKYGLKYQLLHSWKAVFPELTGTLSDLSGKTFTAPLPSSVRRILQGEHLTGEGL